MNYPAAPQAGSPLRYDKRRKIKPLPASGGFIRPHEADLSA